MLPLSGASAITIGHLASNFQHLAVLPDYVGSIRELGTAYRMRFTYSAIRQLPAPSWVGYRKDVIKDTAMLDWKKRAGDLRDNVDDSVDDVRSYFGGLWLSRALGTLLALYLLGALGIGWFWSQEPELFPVQQNAQAAA